MMAWNKAEGAHGIKQKEHMEWELGGLGSCPSLRRHMTQPQKVSVFSSVK